MLFLIPLNYKIESNSQQYLNQDVRYNAVSDTAKLQNWKQFTTFDYADSLSSMLFLIPLNYKIESNSQHAYQRHQEKKAVSDTAKLQNWKQFTTVMLSSSVH